MQPNSPGQAKDIQHVMHALALFKAKQHLGALQLQAYPTNNPAVRLARKAILDGFEHCFRAMGLTHLPCEHFSKEYCELSRQHIEAWRLEQAVYARKFVN